MPCILEMSLQVFAGIARSAPVREARARGQKSVFNATSLKA